MLHCYATGRMKTRNVLFLDVDGVLHPLRVEFRDGKVIDDHMFVSSCCTELQRVINETGADIVLSSSWRAYEGPREKLAAALQMYGLHFSEWTTTRDIDGTRGSQILDYLEQHSQQVAQWAVVDDEPLGKGLEPSSMMEQVLYQRWVRTDSQVGLTKQGADTLIALLNEVDVESD